MLSFVEHEKCFITSSPGILLPVYLPLFLQESTCKPFLEIKICRIMLTDNSRKYLCRAEGLL